MFTTKAQKEGLAVSIIIGAILVFMIIYIIVAPPEVRDELLPPEEYGARAGISSAIQDEFLSVTPGVLTTEESNTQSYSMPTFNLYFKNEPIVSTISNRLVVYRDWFSKKYPSLNFVIDDLDNLKQTDLIFSATEADGDLEIYINGKLLQDQELSTGIQTVNVPVSYLQKENQLVFETDFPFFPWSSNNYDFSQIALKQTFERINAKVERSVYLEKVDLDNAVKAKLTYNQLCNQAPRAQSDLRVLLNDQEIYNSEILCASGEQEIILPRNFLKEGDNKFIFIIESGDFTLAEPKLKIESRGRTYPTYAFKISDETFANIDDGSDKVMLEAVMAGSNLKEAIITINGHQIVLNTKEQLFSSDVSNFVKKGTNSLRIIPKKKFEMISLDVNLA